jgi:hypothetical protein
MEQPMAGESEQPLHKFLFLVLDKVLLAGVIAAFGVAVAFYADIVKTPWSFQDELFEKRFNAYAEIAQRADTLLLDLASYYDNLGSDTVSKPWRETFSLVDEKYHQLLAQRAGFGSSHIPTSGGAFKLPTTSLVENIRALQHTWEKHIFLIPTPLRDRFDNYFKTILADLNVDLDAKISVKQSDPVQYSDDEPVSLLEKDESRQRWLRAYRVHNELLAELRATIGLDLSPPRILE